MRERFIVRETEYGHGIWDLLLDDWWIPRLDMARRDAELIVDELNQGGSITGPAREEGPASG